MIPPSPAAIAEAAYLLQGSANPELRHVGRLLADLTAGEGGLAFGTLRTDILAVRDRLLGLLAGLYSGSQSGMAKAIERDAARYASDCWPRQRHDFGPPAHHRGKHEEVLFALHQNAEWGGARWPLRWRYVLDRLQSTG